MEPNQNVTPPSQILSNSQATNSNSTQNPPVVTKKLVGQPKNKSNTFSVDNLLVETKSQPSLSVMSLLNHQTTNSAQVQRPPTPGFAISIRKPRTPQQPVTKPQAPLPQRTLLGNGNESWYLRCFCDIKTEQGFMIQCEKCLNWQHAACLNINQNTLPVNYSCPICSNKNIRCRCQENMNYTIPLVRCSKCGYYVHRKCEDLGSGPYWPANHVCIQCEGQLCQPPDVHLPYDINFKNPVVIITQATINQLHPAILTTPFISILTEDFMNRSMSAIQFCESVYNKHRPFFFLTHPSIANFPQPKKKRGDVAFSFFRSVFYVLDFLYKMTQDISVSIFNCLVLADIYQPFTMPTTILPNNPNCVEFSDPAKADYEKAVSKHTPELTQVSFQADLVVVNGSVYCKSVLQPEQLIGVATGFIGLIDEFNYDNGADNHFYAICSTTTTKYVLDARKAGGQLIHNFRRSLSPNCVVKLFKFSGLTYVGIFAGVSDVNGIARRTRREKFQIQPDTELTLPIDFAPATIEEPSDFMGWHLEDIEFSQGQDGMSSLSLEKGSSSGQLGSQNNYGGLSSGEKEKDHGDRLEVSHSSSSTNVSNLSDQAYMPPGNSQKYSRPSREERDCAAALRQLERKKKKKKQKEDRDLKKDKMKRKPGNKGIKSSASGNIKNGPKTSELPESTLFSMIQQTSPEQYLFDLQSTEEEDIDDDISGDIVINDEEIFNGDVDCSFLDKFMCAEIRPIARISVGDPIKEMEEMLDLSEFK
ncbi:hypothetical protein M9Y10_011539 [Tritrichomonas musculus]|uniref:Zinc finger PHD-type domain-containing protein n=2 Tax=Tritrichomonas musculus TaxID=1915356 RepID=A0ABR2IL04_9EUKA